MTKTHEMQKLSALRFKLNFQIVDDIVRVFVPVASAASLFSHKRFCFLEKVTNAYLSASTYQNQLTDQKL